MAGEPDTSIGEDEAPIEADEGASIASAADRHGDPGVAIVVSLFHLYAAYEIVPSLCHAAGSRGLRDVPRLPAVSDAPRFRDRMIAGGTGSLARLDRRR